MQLQDFFDYKNRLMEDILTTEDIVRLLDENVPMEHADSLAYRLVYPYEYVPETVEDGDTIICFDVDIQSVAGKTFLTPVIYIWILVHKSKLRLPEGGVRTDKICSEIAKKINGSRFYGLGELQLGSTKRFVPMTDYQGKAMTFYAREFNRVYNPKQPVPSNRKTGS